jgi:hypothetical protein
MLWVWVGFIVFVCVLIAIDLGVLNRKHHVIGTVLHTVLRMPKKVT